MTKELEHCKERAFLFSVADDASVVLCADCARLLVAKQIAYPMPDFEGELAFVTLFPFEVLAAVLDGGAVVIPLAHDGETVH